MDSELEADRPDNERACARDESEDMIASKRPPCYSQQKPRQNENKERTENSLKGKIQFFKKKRVGRELTT